MPAPVAARVLLLLLCTSSSARAQSPLDSWQMTKSPRLVVTPEMARQSQEAHISPGRTLTLVFDTPVRREGLKLRERERFREMSLSEDGLLLSLLPLGELPLGERLGLTVDFTDGAAPVSLDFTLVVSPQAEAQLEVYRQPRSAASYQREAEETQLQLSQCQAELRKEHAENERPPGLLGLLAVIQLGKAGVHGKDIATQLTSPSGTLDVRQAFSYRAAEKGESPFMRLAVDVRLSNNSPLPLRPARAQFVGPGGSWQAEVWAPTPLAPGEQGRVLVEVARPGLEAPGTYLLKLWDEEGRQLAVLSGVTFP